MITELPDEAEAGRGWEVIFRVSRSGVEQLMTASHLELE